MGEKILITGGGGFIGSHLAEAEINNGNTVIALDIAPPNKVSHLLNNKNFRYVQGDVADKGLMESLIKEVDMVDYFAAIANPKIYLQDPARVLRVNLEGFQLAIKLAFLHNKKFILASSSEVYAKNPRVPWQEDEDRVLGSTTKGRWIYSTAKATAEYYCFAYAKQGLRMAMCRFFNFYGPRLDAIGKGRVIPCFLGKFLAKEPIEVVAPGTQTRCFTYISDGVEGILKVAHLPEAEGKVFNLGRVEEITMLDLARLMKKIGNFSSEIRIVPAEKKYGKGYEDAPRRVPDISRAKETLNWEPRTGLEEGLKKVIDYYT